MTSTVIFSRVLYSHYVVCVVQLLTSSDQVKKMRVEAEVMNETLANNAHDLVRLDEKCQHLELELTVSQEEHRTCQAVVSVIKIMLIVIICQ